MDEHEPHLWGAIPAEGCEIVAIEFWGANIVLTAERGRTTDDPDYARVRLAMGGPARFSRPGRPPLTFTSDDRWETIADLLALQYKKIASLSVDGESNLSLETVDGWKIEIGPDPKYEAWELNGPGAREKRIATPGGGEPAVWL